MQVYVNVDNLTAVQYEQAEMNMQLDVSLVTNSYFDQK